MPVFSNNSTQKKYKNKNLIFKLSLSFLVVFSLVLINLIFNILSFINSFLLGFFGLSIYAILLSLITYSLMMLFNKKITINKKQLTFLILSAFFFLCILNILTTSNEISSLNYRDYLSYAYNEKTTAGGLFASIFVYPVQFITNNAISNICIFLILLVISIFITIYSFYSSFKDASFAQSIEEKSKIASKEKNIEDKNISEHLETTYKENDESKKEKQYKNYDESIFVEDEEVIEANNSIKSNNKIDESNSSADRKEELLKAKSVLGLIKESENQERKEEELSSNIKRKNQPQKIVHEDDGFQSEGNKISISHNYPKKLSESELKSLEFLRATRGEKLAEMKQNNRATPSDLNTNKLSESTRNYQNKLNEKFSQNEYPSFNKAKNNDFSEINELINKKPFQESDSNFKNSPNDRKNDYKINVINNFNNSNKSNDLFDENLTLNEYKNNKEKYQQNYNKISNKINNFSTGIKNADKFYTGEVNEGIVESVSFNKAPIKKIQQISIREEKPPNHFKPYISPPTDLLKYSPNVERIDDSSEQEEKARSLEEVLQSFKIPATVDGIVKGPTFTRYEMKMPSGIPVSKIFSYQNDIKMQLRSSEEIRIEAPIPGKSAFGIEVVNENKDIVCLRDIIESDTFQNSKSPLTFVLGKDIVGDTKIAKIDRAPHLLIAGSTGSGKSVLLNALLISLLYKNSPDDLKLILIDPKKVEFTMYNHLPHLLIPTAITEIDKAISAFEWLIMEMERRYCKFTELCCRDISSYNQNPQVISGLKEKMPYIVLIVDEMADIIIQAKKEIEDRINRLAAKSRAAGIHIVLATQRPSVDIITGLIKNNLPTRIAFKVTSQVDSKTILDRIGAERLVGRGDMLFMCSDSSNLERIQGAFVSDQEVENVVRFIKENNDADFDSDIYDEMFNSKKNSFDEKGVSEEEYDPILIDALRLVIRNNKASTSGIQRAFGIGYPRAGKIIDQMERLNFISPPDNKNNRTIFITQQEFEEKFGEDFD